MDFVKDIAKNVENVGVNAESTAGTVGEQLPVDHVEEEESVNLLESSEDEPSTEYIMAIEPPADLRNFDNHSGLVGRLKESKTALSDLRQRFVLLERKLERSRATRNSLAEAQCSEIDGYKERITILKSDHKKRDKIKDSAHKLALKSKDEIIGTQRGCLSGTRMSVVSGHRTLQVEKKQIKKLERQNSVFTTKLANAIMEAQNQKQRARLIQRDLNAKNAAIAALEVKVKRNDKAKEEAKLAIVQLRLVSQKLAIQSKDEKSKGRAAILALELEHRTKLARNQAIIRDETKDKEKERKEKAEREKVKRINSRLNTIKTMYTRGSSQYLMTRQQDPAYPRSVAESSIPSGTFPKMNAPMAEVSTFSIPPFSNIQFEKKLTNFISSLF
jgi:hypothetical protein